MVQKEGVSAVAGATGIEGRLLGGAMKVVVALVAVMVSGCAGASDDGPKSSTPTAGPQVLAITAPQGLAVGDYWTWTRPDGTTYTYAIAQDAGGDWLMGTDSEAVAFFDARTDISTLGAVRKSDLAGSQGSTRVEFFRFPLVANATWSTSWDAEPKDVRVTDVAQGIARLEARRADGSLYAAYSYDNATSYFGELDFFNANGTAQFGSKVTAHGRGYTGPLVSWQLNTVARLGGDLANAPVGTISFDVPVTATDVWVNLALACTTGFANLGVAPAPFVGAVAGTDERGAGTPQSPCPIDVTTTGSAGAPAAPAAPPGAAAETWGYEVLVAPQTVGTFELEILVRTLVTTGGAAA